eukprot:TRINITY_DN31875_c0_g1_i1.p1 TRINITY_DN31875_c0_g1~~TRINITY_DN31875_c0_g1_i1.p1  ORF type:complete len:782 (+),score=114.61 TRINITY_DN31875_c0_g1_i1:122-2467(+)
MRPCGNRATSSADASPPRSPPPKPSSVELMEDTMGRPSQSQPSGSPQRRRPQPRQGMASTSPGSSQCGAASPSASASLLAEGADLDLATPLEAMQAAEMPHFPASPEVHGPASSEARLGSDEVVATGNSRLAGDVCPLHRRKPYDSERAAARDALFSSPSTPLKGFSEAAPWQALVTPSPLSAPSSKGSNTAGTETTSTPSPLLARAHGKGIVAIGNTASGSAKHVDARGETRDEVGHCSSYTGNTKFSQELEVLSSSLSVSWPEMDSWLMPSGTFCGADPSVSPPPPPVLYDWHNQATLQHMPWLTSSPTFTQDEGAGSRGTAPEADLEDDKMQPPLVRAIMSSHPWCSQDVSELESKQCLPLESMPRLLHDAADQAFSRHQDARSLSPMSIAMLRLDRERREDCDLVSPRSMLRSPDVEPRTPSDDGWRTKSVYLRQAASPHPLRQSPFLSAQFASPVLNKQCSLGIGVDGASTPPASPQRQAPPKLAHRVSDASQDVASTLCARHPNDGRLGRDFSELAMVGKGDFATVYRATHRMDRQAYAIKVVSSDSPRASRSASREVLALSSVYDCPNVVRYFSSWVEDGRVHLQTELCERSLRDLLEERRLLENEPEFPESTISNVLHDCANGLEALHRSGYVHLDVKPDNILFNRGRYKVADLGHSVEFVDVCRDDVNDGDSRYLSKEVMLRDVSDLPRADVFALGLVCFELATNPTPLPLNGDEWQRLRDPGLTVQLMPRLSRQLAEMLISMTHPVPNERPKCGCIASRLGFAAQASSGNA